MDSGFRINAGNDAWTLQSDGCFPNKRIISA